MYRSVELRWFSSGHGMLHWWLRRLFSVKIRWHGWPTLLRSHATCSGRIYAYLIKASGSARSRWSSPPFSSSPSSSSLSSSPRASFILTNSRGSFPSWVALYAGKVTCNSSKFKVYIYILLAVLHAGRCWNSWWLDIYPVWSSLSSCTWCHLWCTCSRRWRELYLEARGREVLALRFFTSLYGMSSSPIF